MIVKIFSWRSPFMSFPAAPLPRRSPEMRPKPPKTTRNEAKPPYFPPFLSQNPLPCRVFPSPALPRPPSPAGFPPSPVPPAPSPAPAPSPKTESPPEVSPAGVVVGVVSGDPWRA